VQNIKIGTLVPIDRIGLIPKLIGYGFESFSIMFWETAKGFDLVKIADELSQMLQGSDAVISCLSIFGNPLLDCERGGGAREGWYGLIDMAEGLGVDLVTGFAGRLIDRPVPESIPKFKEVFTPIAEKAKEKGMRIAFENCDMGGNWERGDFNIAFTPRAWEMMFEALPYDNAGLQWEPCHQLIQFIDPIPQLRKWVHKVFNLHGKDATIAWDILRDTGIRSGIPYCWHRTPGFGDSNWTDIITILRMGGFKGSIDIEGFHDPVYINELEYTGQVHALNYLKQCRGGDFVCLG